jgi:hypothetical protein
VLWVLLPYEFHKLFVLQALVSQKVLFPTSSVPFPVFLLRLVKLFLSLSDMNPIVSI